MPEALAVSFVSCLRKIACSRFHSLSLFSEVFGTSAEATGFVGEADIGEGEVNGSDLFGGDCWIGGCSGCLSAICSWGKMVGVCNGSIYVSLAAGTLLGRGEASTPEMEARNSVATCPCRCTQRVSLSLDLYFCMERMDALTLLLRPSLRRRSAPASELRPYCCPPGAEEPSTVWAVRLRSAR